VHPTDVSDTSLGRVGAAGTSSHGLGCSLGLNMTSLMVLLDAPRSCAHARSRRRNDNVGT